MSLFILIVLLTIVVIGFSYIKSNLGTKELFTTEQEALDRAVEIGCEGSHTHVMGLLHMPCETHTEALDKILMEAENE